MRVAVVSLWPKQDGVTEFCRQLCYPGGPELLTFTRSGRPHAGWPAAPQRRVHRLTAMINVLNSYDLVILSDPASLAPAMQEGDGRPAYLRALRALTVPVTAMVHDGALVKKLHPFVAELASSPSFAGVFLATRREAGDLIQAATGRTIRMATRPYLPYRCPPITATPEYDLTRVMMTGRLAPNKGQDRLLAAFAAGLERHIEIWGADPFRRFGQYSTELHAAATNKEPVVCVGAPGRRGGPFSLLNDATGFRVDYRGPYTGLDSIWWTPAVHLSLTSPALRGTLEYSTLEALAYGRIVAAPHRQYEQADYGPLGWPARLPDDLTDPATLRRAIEMIPLAPEIAADQRQEILPLHAPELFLEHAVAEIGRVA